MQSNYNSDSHSEVDDDDYFPTVEEILRPTSYKESSTEMPTNSNYAIQGTNQPSFLLSHSKGSQG
jgi:hypothetical protein